MFQSRQGCFSPLGALTECALATLCGRVHQLPTSKWLIKPGRPCCSDEPFPPVARHWRPMKTPLRFGPVPARSKCWRTKDPNDRCRWCFLRSPRISVENHWKPLKVVATTFSLGTQTKTFICSKWGLGADMLTAHNHPDECQNLGQSV